MYLLENKYKDSNYISMYFENITMISNLFSDVLIFTFINYIKGL